jgi:hypothetical protein
MKVPVVTTKDFIIYLENYQDNIFIHCDVTSKWTKTVKKDLTKAFNKLNKKELFALHEQSDKKHKKFLKLFNFNYLNTFKGKNGTQYDVFVWR